MNRSGTPWALAIVVCLHLPFGSSAQQESAADGENADPGAAYRAAAKTVDEDLAVELEKLAALRQEIAREKPELARATNELAATLREKRRLAEIVRQESDALLHDLRTLDQRIKLWRDEAGYIDGLLADFHKQYDARASVASYRENQGRGNSAGEASELVESSLTELLTVQRQGGRVIAGQALDQAGAAHEGAFVEVGPLSWFVANESDLAGLVTESGDLRPEVVPGTATAEEVRSLMSGKNASPAFDPTLGAALALNEVEGGFVEHIRQGGLWIWPILLLAIVALVAAALKWLQIARIRDISPTAVRRVLAAVNAGQPEQAEAVLAELRHPAAAILRRGVAEAGQPRELIEETLYEEFVAAQPALQRGLSFIAIASATAPLLGLLGTVTGMIATFQRIRIFGTSDTNVIAGGISEALVTTEVGLAVAIPALIVHALLSRRVQGIRSAMEMTSLAFVNGVKTPLPVVAESNAEVAEP